MIRLQEPCFEEDAKRLIGPRGHDANHRMGSFQRREKIASMAAVPLRVGDEAVGALFVNYRTAQRFDDDPALRQLIEGVAAYAAIAIKNAREMGTERTRYVRSLEALQEFDRELNRSNDLDELLKSILELSQRRLPDRVDEASILLYDPATGELVTREALGPHRGASVGQALHPDAGRGISLHVLRTGRSVIVSDVQDSEWRESFVDIGAGTRSEMDVVLKDGAKVVGVLNLESHVPGAYGQADLQLMETLAGQAVLAVKKAQTYQRLRALEELGRKVLEQIDSPEQVLRAVVHHALRLTGATISDLDLWLHDKWVTHYRAQSETRAHGLEAVEKWDLEAPGAQRPPRGIMAKVVNTRVPFLVEGDERSIPTMPANLGSIVSSLFRF